MRNKILDYKITHAIVMADLDRWFKVRNMLEESVPQGGLRKLLLEKAMIHFSTLICNHLYEALDESKSPDEWDYRVEKVLSNPEQLADMVIVDRLNDVLVDTYEDVLRDKLVAIHQLADDVEYALQNIPRKE